MIDQRLVEAFSRIFSLDPSQVTPQTSVENTADWDSLRHLRLILELEAVFEVRFLSDEIPGLTSLERLQSALQRLKVI